LKPNDSLAAQTKVRKSVENTKPPIGWFIGSVLCTFLALYFLLARGISGHALFHFVGAVVGMIVGLVLMGLFRQATNQRQSSGTFADWPISSVKLGTSVSVGGWILGLANLVVFSIEISRMI
jgi:chromate transport protein ChrA